MKYRTIGQYDNILKMDSGINQLSHYGLNGINSCESYFFLFIMRKERTYQTSFYNKRFIKKEKPFLIEYSCEKYCRYTSHDIGIQKEIVHIQQLIMLMLQRLIASDEFLQVIYLLMQLFLKVKFQIILRLSIDSYLFWCYCSSINMIGIFLKLFVVLEQLIPSKILKTKQF